MDYSAHRPEGHRGKGDSHLPKIVRGLRRTLADVQRSFAYDTLLLPSAILAELAGILVEFAEDLHNRTGIWAAYERYNTELFGTALPLTAGEGEDLGSELGPDRFRHLLWVLYPMFFDGLTLSLTHQDLRKVADAASYFLSDAFSAVPQDSGVKAFLQSPNDYGWEVKRKLIWLGTHSFLFRTMFACYINEEADGDADIAHTDDFVCQECTRWSGLGAIDILAGALDISDDDRKDLRGWYERHAAFYQILAADAETLQALNVINDMPYQIRLSMKGHPFRRGQIIFGSLVPWRGEWYWSGEQSLLGDVSEIDVHALKTTMRRQSPGIVCRYAKDYEVLVRQRMAEQHEQTLRYHGGKDLVVYPDGLSMAAGWQKEFRWQWDQRPPEEVADVIKKHGLKKGAPQVTLPKDLLDEQGGLGVFHNPDEGKEIMTHFTSLVAALKKKDVGLSEEEHAAVRGFVDSRSISPEFARRVLEEYGDESVREAFLLRGDLPGWWLDYLLRTRKGQYYRKRYPMLAVV
jgi:hypothetical protein